MNKKKTVTVRNMILGEGIPKICVPVTAENRFMMKQQTEKILAGPCDMIEWRADYYKETNDSEWLEQTLAYLRELIGELPLLFTFRTKEEGGERSIPMNLYQEWNRRAAASGLADFVDIELNRGVELVQGLCDEIHSCGKKVIISFHDFEKTPAKEELLCILCRMQELGADVSKAAVMPVTDTDVLTLLDVTLQMKENYADRPYITMSMGTRGGITRLSGSLTGSAVTFATAGCSSAPGQMEAELVRELLSHLI